MELPEPIVIPELSAAEKLRDLTGSRRAPTEREQLAEELLKEALWLVQKQ